MTIKYYGATPPPIKMTTSKVVVDLVPHLVSMTISRTMSEVSELVVAVDDPGYAMVKKYGLPLGAKIRTMELDYVVDSLDLDAGGGAGGFTLNCRSSKVRALKKRRGAFVMNKVSPTQWVRHEVKAVGGKFIGQPSAQRARVARQVTSNTDDEKPSTWTTIRSLAEELGFIFYEDNNTFYFGKPSWLVKHVGRAKIDYRNEDTSKRPTTLPKLSASLDEPDATEYSFTMGVEHAVDLVPGLRVDLSSFPARNGTYLLSGLDHPIYGSASDVSLTLTLPIDPEVVKA